MHKKILPAFLLASLLSVPSMSRAFDGIKVAPSFGKGEVPETTVGPRAVPLRAEGQWFAADNITLDLKLKDIHGGVISFWILSLGEPVSAVPQQTAGGRHNAPGTRMGLPEKTALVEAGDLKKNRVFLRIEADSAGLVSANHLSWHNQTQWLAGVSTETPVLVTGRWTHVAYGVGKAGQRLWIDGALVAHNPAGTQSVSWPFQLRFNPSMSIIDNARLDADESAALANAKIPPTFDPQPATSAPVNPVTGELFALIQKTVERRTRLDALRNSLNVLSLPYQQARLNIIHRLAPLTFYRILLESAEPASDGVNLHELARSEARWILDAAETWDREIENIESGKITPFSTTAIIPDASTVTVREGAFWQNGRPVYFVGLQNPRHDITKDLGFTFTGNTVGPSWEMPAPGKLLRTGRGQRRRADLAAANGLFWDILYSGHIFPRWALEQHPELNVGVGFMRHDMLGNPGWGIHKATLDSVLADIKGASNVLGFDLANEPAFNGVTADSLPNWRAWLQRRHGTISELNRRWGASYSGWGDIPAPDFANKEHVQPWDQKFPSTPGLELRQYVDWSYFNLERVNAWFARVNTLVKESLPHTFTYTKMIQNTASNARMGIDVVANVRMTDISGSDSWWVFNGLGQEVGQADKMSGTESSARSDYSVNWIPSLMLYDLLTSARPDAPVANAEFHLFNDTFKPMSPDFPNPPPGHWDRPIPGNHFYAGIWQQAIHGQAMSNLWTHWPRNNISERAEALDAASRASMDLNRLSLQVHALHAAPRQVAILWGLSPVLNDISGKWHPATNRTWQDLWESVTLNGQRPAYVFERDLAVGKLPDPDNIRVIIIPDFPNIDARALQGLNAARSSGIKIWVIGGAENLKMDPYGQAHDPAELPSFDFVFNAETFDQNSFAEMKKALDAANLLPEVQVWRNGAPTRLVHFRTAINDGKRLVNLCNYARHDVNVRIRVSEGHGEGSTRAIDLITGEAVNLSNISLAVEQVRFLHILE